jgi:lambda family phage portal protein
VVNGEAFAHLEVDPAAAALQLRLWNVNQVDRSMNRDIGGGFRIVAGIEFDPRGRRLAYHVRENPDAPFATNCGTIRVPAEDVLHVFEPLFPGQTRGLSWLAPSLTRIAEIDKGEDANLARLNASALFAGFLTKPSEGAPDVLPMAPNAPSVDMEPGAFVQVPPGYSVEFSTPPSGDGAVDFTRAMIRSAAAGAGVPYELVSGDLSQVNYSSARLGLSEFRQRVTAIRRNLIVPQFLDPVWRRWLVLEALAGRIKLDLAALPEAEWVFPGWPAVDPLKETNADIQAINARIRSRFETISARGRDPEDVDAEIALDPPQRSAGAST